MSGRAFGSVLVTSLIAGALEVSAAPGTGDTSPWSAAERLARPSVTEMTVSGWWVESLALVREAVDGEWEGRLRLGYTAPAGGPGVMVEGGRVGAGDDTPTVDLGTGLVWRWNGEAAGAGVRLRRRGDHRSLSVPVKVAVRRGAGLLGASLRIHAEGGVPSPEIVLYAVAAAGFWMGGVQLGPRPRDHRGSVGVRISPDVILTFVLADLHPSYGVHLTLGKVELRAESTFHRALGAVTRVRLVWWEGIR